VLTVPAGVRIYLACGATDMRRGFNSLSVMAQEVLKQDPFSGAVFCLASVHIPSTASTSCCRGIGRHQRRKASLPEPTLVNRIKWQSQALAYDSPGATCGRPRTVLAMSARDCGMRAI